MQLQGKRIAILAENMYEDLELWYPALRLREAGAEVTLVGSGKDTYTSKHGYPVHDARLRTTGADFDALIILADMMPRTIGCHPAMVALVREVQQE